MIKQLYSANCKVYITKWLPFRVICMSENGKRADKKMFSYDVLILIENLSMAVQVLKYV